ncbi:MAG TPA: outer membrane beta-barrel protein [Bdellovibrionales bacterium]|nr:outer membrane beta-barrel protein [Bdellovibrionales bacterium]
MAATQRISLFLILLFTFSIANAAQSKKSRATEVAAPPVVDPVKPQDVPFRFDAFLDAQGLWTDRKDAPTRGFTLNDAALYLSKDFSRGISAHVDLPFSTPEKAHTNSVGFAEKQAQAYFAYTSIGWGGQFGQFDSPFGVEKNDSRDRFFADKGEIGKSLVPLTHSGVLASYQIESLRLGALVANPSDEGTMYERNPEFGALGAVETADRTYGGQIGFTVGEADVPSSNKTNLLVDVLGRYQKGRFQFNAGFNSKKTAGTDKTANGLGLLGILQFDEELAAGARFEYLTDVVGTLPTGGTTIIEKVMTLTLGPSYKLAPNFIVRGDFTLGNYDYPSPTEDRTTVSLGLSMVASL